MLDIEFELSFTSFTMGSGAAGSSQFILNLVTRGSEARMFLVTCNVIDRHYGVVLN